MSRLPEVSVVMSVLNSAETLTETLDSVLGQLDVSFELIAINDGSTDDTPRILDEAAAHDDRVRVLHQENRGLTASLIRGCEAARGRFIARQDASGDRSLPSRLQTLAQALRAAPAATLASSGARFVGPRREFLFEVRGTEVDLSLRGDGSDVSVRGPAAHGATMFRKDDYLAVGGYREQFAVAQDLDLWLRLVERGEHVGIPEVLYEFCVSPDSISGLWRDRQVQTTRIILECARHRRQGLDEHELLARASRMPRKAPARRSRRARSRAVHFIARCLHQHDPAGARRYYLEAVREFPLNLKSGFFLLSTLFARRDRAGR